MYIERDEKFSVELNLEREGHAYRYESIVMFSYDPNTYGNSYYMYVKSSVEPFGGQSYDIRYDSKFHSDNLMKYVIDFYLDRFDGLEGRCKINSIKVTEKEFIEP